MRRGGVMKGWVTRIEFSDSSKIYKDKHYKTTIERIEDMVPKDKQKRFGGKAEHGLRLLYIKELNTAALFKNDGKGNWASWTPTYFQWDLHTFLTIMELDDWLKIKGNYKVNGKTFRIEVCRHGMRITKHNEIYSEMSGEGWKRFVKAVAETDEINTSEDVEGWDDE